MDLNPIRFAAATVIDLDRSSTVVVLSWAFMIHLFKAEGDDEKDEKDEKGEADPHPEKMTAMPRKAGNQVTNKK